MQLMSSGGQGSTGLPELEICGDGPRDPASFSNLDPGFSRWRTAVGARSCK